MPIIRHLLILTNQITIECWVNTRTLSGHQTISRKTDAYGLGIGSGGNIGFYIFDSPGSWHGSWNLSSQSLQTLLWYHIAGVWDGVTMKVYINGVQDPTTYAYNGPAASNTNAVYIGENPSGPQEFFNGSVDELKVYNIALSSDTILAHYNSVPHSIPILIAYTPNPTYNWRPLLQWHANPAISLFRIQIATDTAFSSPTVSLTTTDTFYLPTADMPLGAIYWRVADEVTAGLDFWSTRSSVCILRDSIPVLVPVTPDTQRTQRPRLSWYRVPTAPSSYLLQIDLAGNFATPYFSTTLTDTTYLMTANLPLGKIFWRVGAVYNTTTLYSSTDTFWIAGTGTVPKTTNGNTLSTSASFVQLRRGTAVNYSLEKQSAVSLDIFSIAGSRIATVYRGSAPAGNHSITWDGTGKGGKQMPAGSYLAIFKINERTFTKIIMFMR